MDIELWDKMLDEWAKAEGYESVKDYMEKKYPDEEFAI